MDKKISDKLKQNMYYVIIGAVSFIALVFLPMIGSEAGLNWNVPNTIVGWIVWVATRLLVSTVNVLIFYSFIQQGKLNAKNNENYKKACDILYEIKDEKYIPRSPKRWHLEQYGRKGVTLFIGTAMSAVALTQAILTFDWVSMLSYCFTIAMGLIFGVLQMKNAEEYWTEEFLKYAKMIQAQKEAEKQKAIDPVQQIINEQIQQARGTGPQALEKLEVELSEEEQILYEEVVDEYLKEKKKC